MPSFSFDIVSTFDKAEMNNAFDQAQREIVTRYDFKGTAAAIEWLSDKKGIKVIADNAWQVEQVRDLLSKKLAVRGLTSKILDTSDTIHEANLRAWQDIHFREGLDQTKSKELTKLIRDNHPRVKTTIQGDAVRVTSSSKDELQNVMKTITSAQLGYPIEYINYR